MHVAFVADVYCHVRVNVIHLVAPCVLQTSGRYWPASTDSADEYGPMTVQLTAENEEHANIRTRDMTLKFDEKV